MSNEEEERLDARSIPSLRGTGAAIRSTIEPVFRLYLGAADQDLVDWLQTIPRGQRARTVKQALREHLRQTGQLPKEGK